MKSRYSSLYILYLHGIARKSRILKCKSPFTKGEWERLWAEGSHKTPPVVSSLYKICIGKQETNRYTDTSQDCCLYARA